MIDTPLKLSALKNILGAKYKYFDNESILVIIPIQN